MTTEIENIKKAYFESIAELTRQYHREIESAHSCAENDVVFARYSERLDKEYARLQRAYSDILA